MTGLSGVLGLLGCLGGLGLGRLLGAGGVVEEVEVAALSVGDGVALSGAVGSGGGGDAEHEGAEGNGERVLHCECGCVDCCRVWCQKRRG